MKYSIIIPHHNIPKLLRRAIASIPRRDDLEVIVVDDASDQMCHKDILQVCSDYEAKLIELSVNGGGGKARNEGLKVAKGEFILFLDADDFFNYCVNDILDDYANSNFDLVFFKGSCVDNDTYKTGNRLDYLNEKIDRWFKDPKSGEELLKYEFGVPVCKIIRKELIDTHCIKFDETPIHNDTTFAYTLGYYAKNITADNRCMYCATTREGSVSKQTGPEMRLITIDILGRETLFFRHHNKTYGEYDLSCNLYLLLREKNYLFFNKAIDNLMRLGFKQNDIETFFPKQMAIDSIKSTIWIVFFSPNMNIRMRSLLYLFTKAIPSFFYKKIKKKLIWIILKLLLLV